MSVSPIFSLEAWTSASNLVEAIPGAGIAQLVEHVICNLGVAGSNPAAGTIYPIEIIQTSLPARQAIGLSFAQLRQLDGRNCQFGSTVSLPSMALAMIYSTFPMDFA